MKLTAVEDEEAKCCITDARHRPNISRETVLRAADGGVCADVFKLVGQVETSCVCGLNSTQTLLHSPLQKSEPTK